MAAPEERLGIEFISVLGMPPVQFVELAADLGVSWIGMAPAPIGANPHRFPAWDLRDDLALLRATKSALADRGIRVGLGEGVVILPGIEIADASRTLDVMAEIGAPRVNAVVVESDRSRAFDQFARFASMAQEREMGVTLEFMPLMWPATLDEALEFITGSGAAEAQLLIDAMHLYRSGASSADLANVDPARIGHVQLCDVPMPARQSDYGTEARDERLCPGEGDLPLSEFLAALPHDLAVGLEVPMASKAEAGSDARERLTPCIRAARELLSTIS